MSTGACIMLFEKKYILSYRKKTCVCIVRFVSLRPSQRFFFSVIPLLNHYLARINVSC